MHDREDPTGGDALAIPMGKYVSGRAGKYVSVRPLQLGNFVSADRLTTRLPRDHYVRLDSNDYSVDPTMIGRRVEVQADAEQVEIRCGDRIVARHSRCWARHQSITDPDHAAAAAKLRAAVHAAAKPAAPGGEVQQRALTDYDRMFGLDEQAA